MDATFRIATSRRQAVFLSPFVIITLLFGVCILLLVLSLTLGSVRIPLDEVWRILTGEGSSRVAWDNIVLKFRLPKAITALLAGSALGISGLMMQTFFRNPLADPFILGISSGASLGVALVVLTAGTVGGVMLAGLGLSGDLLLVTAAAMGAGIAMMVVLLVARSVRNNMTLLILGLMFGYLTGAFVSLLMHFSMIERIQAYINWTFGSFSGVTWSQMVLFMPLILIGLGGALVLSKTLNALLLGEQYAQSMGLNVKQARLKVIVITAILTGVTTAFCGPIGFIGVAVPHIARNLLQTADHRWLTPATLLIGAIVALLASFIAELPGSQIVLPLNAVTALMGAPIVMSVILRQRRDV